MRFLIAEPDRFSQRALTLLSEVAEVDCRSISQADIPGALAEYDVVWIRLHLKVMKSDIPASTRCRYLVSATTGTDHIDMDAAGAAGIEVVSLRGHDDFLKTILSTAEHTLGLILALVRQLPWSFDSVREGNWDRDSFRGHELQGKTAGIIGYGRLGKTVAGYLKAMGVKILAHDPNVAIDDEGVEQCRDLGELLSSSDLLSVHVDLNPSSERLLDRERFEIMKSGAFFVNTSRGPVVDEEALLAALNSGRLTGAAVDVICGEPAIDGNHALVRYAKTHNNLLITSHIGGGTFEAMENCEIYLAEILRNSLGKQCK